MTTTLPTLPVSVEQIAIAVRQMSVTDRRRLLELAPELREAVSQPRTLKEAAASVEYTRAAVQAALGDQPLSADTPFLDDLTLGQYLDLPEDDRAALWDTWAARQDTGGMLLTGYISAAMRKATYEMLPDSTFYGEVPGLQGVYANADTLHDCRQELQEVLEGWIALGLRLGHTLPVLDGVALVVEMETA